MDDMIVVSPNDKESMDKIAAMPVNMPAEYRHKKTCQFYDFWMPLFSREKWGEKCGECGGKQYAFAKTPPNHS